MIEDQNLSDNIIRPGTGLYQSEASKYAGMVITLWIITSIVTNIVLGHLISWSSLLLFIPGIFVVSLFAIPFFFLKMKKTQVLYDPRFDSMKSSKKIALLSIFTITTALQYIYPIAASIVSALLLRGF